MATMNNLWQLFLPLWVLVALGFVAIYLIKKIGGKLMASADQALADLTKLDDDLTAAVQSVSDEFAALLTAIKNNNGVNPGAIETLVTRGEGLVATLNAAVQAAKDATNPPPPPATPPAEPPAAEAPATSAAPAPEAPQAAATGDAAADSSTAASGTTTG